MIFFREFAGAKQKAWQEFPIRLLELKKYLVKLVLYYCCQLDGEPTATLRAAGGCHLCEMRKVLEKQVSSPWALTLHTAWIRTTTSVKRGHISFESPGCSLSSPWSQEAAKLHAYRLHWIDHNGFYSHLESLTTEALRPLLEQRLWDCNNKTCSAKL